jgi:hypothetical protein
VFFVRLGGKPVEFDKGKSGIAVASAEKLPLPVLAQMEFRDSRQSSSPSSGANPTPPMQKKKALNSK